MTTDMFILNLLAQGWPPLTQKMVEDFELAWPQFLRRVRGGVARVFGFTPEPSGTTDSGLRVNARLARVGYFWYDYPGYAVRDLRDTEHAIIHDGKRFCIPEFPESWRG